MNINDQEFYTHTPKRKTRARRASIFAGLLVIGGAFLFGLITSTYSPKGFIPDTLITIEQGATTKKITGTLKENNIIRSEKLLLLFLKWQYPEAHIIAGDYLFEKPQTLFRVAERIVGAEYGDSRIRVTIPEGSTREEIAELFTEEKFPNFNPEEFVRRTQEGYLFPDTYFFFPTTSTSQVISVLKDSYKEVIEEFEDEIKESAYSEKEIITMASIIEREAAGKHDSYVISGILWKRIEKGIPLQVDAPFVYIIGKGSSSLTREDLKINSPYNTYENKGLPPGPIGNPGKVAIQAALRPESSPYLFYLHDRNGGVHYARTHDEHVANKNRYLR